MRSGVYLALLHKVNKLPKSKASWSSIIPKWEVGGGVRGKRMKGVGQRGAGQGPEEERSSWERKWTVEVVNSSDIC